MNKYKKKFRGYNKELGWIYGFGMLPIMNDKYEIIGYNIFNENGNHHVEVGSEGEYSGLTYEGVDIYERDVVTKNRPTLTRFQDSSFTGVVTFNEGAWWIDNGNDAVLLWSKWHEYEIVGIDYK